MIFVFTAAFSQQPVLTPTQTSVKLTSAEFVGQEGLTVEKLVELGQSRRGDLLAARQRLAIAEGAQHYRLLFDTFSVGTLYCIVRRVSPFAILFVAVGDFFEFSNSF